LDRTQRCEHRRQFDFEYRLAHLRDELTQAAREIRGLYERARQTLDATTLTKELHFAVDVGGVDTCGFKRASLDLALEKLTREISGRGN
jgi:hypothetical protein